MPLEKSYGLQNLHLTEGKVNGPTQPRGKKLLVHNSPPPLYLRLALGFAEAGFRGLGFFLDFFFARGVAFAFLLGSCRNMPETITSTATPAANENVMLWPVAARSRKLASPRPIEREFMAPIRAFIYKRHYTKSLPRVVGVWPKNMRARHRWTCSLAWIRHWPPIRFTRREQ